MKAGLALFGSSAIYASFGPLIRVLAEMFGDYAQVAARMGLAFIFLLIFALLFGRIRKLTRNQIISAILLGAASTGILVFFTMGVVQVKIATAVFLLYAASMISSLIFGTVFFKETLGIQKIIALALGSWACSYSAMFLSHLVSAWWRVSCPAFVRVSATVSAKASKEQTALLFSSISFS